MSLKYICALFLCFFLIGKTFAQSKNDTSGTTVQGVPRNPSRPFILKPTIGVGAGMFSFRGDVINKSLANNFVANVGYEIYLEQQVSKAFSFRFDYITGKLSANERNYTQPLNFQSTIHSGGINMVYNFFHILPEDFSVSPYISLGVESFEFLSKTDLIDSKGNKYNYWSDGSIRNLAENSPNAGQSVIIKRDYTYESDLREANIDKLGKYQERSWAIPIAFGANFKITDRINLKVGSSIHYTFTDLIDNVSSKSVGTRKGDSKNDKYIYSSFSLSFNLTNPKDLEDYLYPPATKEQLLAADSGDYDVDGVADILDREGLTPNTAQIDTDGVALDTDRDGIQNHKDDELESANNAVVDTKGVALNDELMQQKYDAYYDSTGRSGKYVILPDVYSTGFTPSANAGVAADGKFMVMVGDFKTGVPPELINKFLSISDITSKTTPDSTTVYTVGKYSYYNAAVARKADMELKGVKDAKVIVWNGDKYEIIDQSNFKKYEPTEALAVSGEATEDGGELLDFSKPKNTDTKTKDNKGVTNGTKEPNKTKTNNGSAKNNGGINAGTINDNPDELVFRIQLGAYSKPLSTNVFRGVNDLVAVPTQDGITRYLTGHYNNFNDAAKQRIDMISKGFPGAFVVVYKGGKRISLTDAGVKSVANTPENTPTPEEESNSADKKQVIFKVQIGVFKKDAPDDLKTKIAGFKNVETATTVSGLKRYTVGSYNSYADAQAKKKEMLDAGIKDAFVIAFFKENQIDISEALELLK